MFNWLKQFSVASQLRALALLAVVSLLGVAATLMWSSYARQVMARQDAVRQAVELAHTTIQWVHARQEAGELNERQAQKMALAALDKLRFGGTEYFWVHDMNLRMVHHPIRPQLDGQDIANTQDASGAYVFKNIVELVRTKGQGFVTYQWPKPGVSQAQDRVSYVKGFAPWGWVLGAGQYLDDVQAAFREQAFATCGPVLITALIMWGLIEITARRLEVIPPPEQAPPRSQGLDSVKTPLLGAHQISDVIGLIDGIACQTDLLAQRSALAAREIKSLIHASIDADETGIGPAQNNGHTVQSIAASVDKVATLIHQLTPPMVSPGEGPALTADHLKDQADTITQAVSRFRVAGAF